MDKDSEFFYKHGGWLIVFAFALMYILAGIGWFITKFILGR